MDPKFARIQTLPENEIFAVDHGGRLDSGAKLGPATW
jgi:hypothetical protein